MEHKVHHSVWRGCHFSLALATLIQLIPSHPCPISFISVLPSHIECGLFLHQHPACQSPSHTQPTCHTLLILLNLKTLIIFDEQHKSWSTSLRNFLQPPITYYFQNPTTYVLSLIVRKKNANPYKTTGKTRFPHTFFMSHGEQKYKWI